jgi:hypothetical protein
VSTAVLMKSGRDCRMPFSPSAPNYTWQEKMRDVICPRVAENVVSAQKCVISAPQNTLLDDSAQIALFARADEIVIN